MLFALPLADSATMALPNANAKLVAYCESRMGQKVGSGQCADLPNQALLALGLDEREDDAPNPGDYVWGRLIATIEPRHLDEASGVVPGDIVQYRSVVFQHRTRFSWSQSSAPHHTSVVAAVSPDRLSVYEQNVNGRMAVVRNDLELKDLKSGTLWVYRAELSSPIPPVRSRLTPTAPIRVVARPMAPAPAKRPVAKPSRVKSAPKQPASGARRSG